MSERRFPWRTLLFCSVAVNLLIIGAVAGALGAGVRLQREAPGAVVDRMPGPRAFLRALPEEAREKMREELAGSWEQSRELRQAAIEARRDAFRAAYEEPYDVARVQAAFAELRAADQAAVAVFHDNVAEAFGAMSVEERREALEALRRAAPASRQALAPAEEGAADSAEAPRPALSEEERRARREARRERMRERRAQRQAAPEAPAP